MEAALCTSVSGKEQVGAAQARGAEPAGEEEEEMLPSTSEKQRPVSMKRNRTVLLQPDGTHTSVRGHLEAKGWEEDCGYFDTANSLGAMLDSAWPLSGAMLDSTCPLMSYPYPTSPAPATIAVPRAVSPAAPSRNGSSSSNALLASTAISVVESTESVAVRGGATKCASACGTPDTRDRKPCDKCKRKRKGINYCINLGHARPSDDGERRDGDQEPCDESKRCRKGANYCIHLGHARPSDDGERRVAPPAAAGAVNDEARAAPVDDERLVTDLTYAITSRWHPTAAGQASVPPSSPSQAPSSVTVRTQAGVYRLVCAKCKRQSFGSARQLALFPCACGAVACGRARRFTGALKIRLDQRSATAARAIAEARSSIQDSEDGGESKHEDTPLMSQPAGGKGNEVLEAPLDITIVHDVQLPASKRHAGPRPASSGHHGSGGWGGAASAAATGASSSGKKCLGRDMNKSGRQNTVPCSSGQEASAAPAPSMRERGESKRKDARHGAVNSGKKRSRSVMKCISKSTSAGGRQNAISIATPPHSIKWEVAWQFENLLCTQFNTGLWNKTNSLKVLLDGLATQGLVRPVLSCPTTCDKSLLRQTTEEPFPFFRVNGQDFSHLEVLDPHCVYDFLCAYITASPLFASKGRCSQNPDGRLYNLFNDLGFLSRSFQPPPAGLKGQKDLYYWDAKTWNEHKARRSVNSDRKRKDCLELRLDVQSTATFPVHLYDFGAEKLFNKEEKSLVLGMLDRLGDRLGKTQEQRQEWKGEESEKRLSNGNYAMFKARASKKRKGLS